MKLENTQYSKIFTQIIFQPIDIFMLHVYDV